MTRGSKGSDDREAVACKQEGFWDPIIQLPNVAVHTHLLPNGKVLFWGRRVDLNGGMDQHLCDVYVLDPTTLEIRRAPSPVMPDGSSVNLFCSAHAFLPDGRLFVAGGHLVDNEGVNQACLYDWKQNAWTPLPAMNHGRWYPGVILLLDGKVLVAEGTYREGADTPHNNIPQIWSERIGWRNLSGEDLSGKIILSLYPRMHVLGSHRVFVAGTNPGSKFLDPSGSGVWSEAPSRAHGDRQYAPSLTYAPGKIIYIGGGNEHNTNIPTAACEVIDFNRTTPAWQPTNPMSRPRRQHNATLLPDGTVLVTGGTKGGGFDNGFNDLRPGEPVHEAEFWDPTTQAWTLLAAEAEDRCYHSTALLLPDGRVLSAGGGEYKPNNQPIQPQDVHTTAQIFSPPYLFRSARPKIETADPKTDFGSNFIVKFSGTVPVRATLVKPGSVTHAMDTNQRFLELGCRVNGQQATLTLPAKPAGCPPGFYMLFLLSADGVPSVAHLVQIARASEAPASFDIVAPKDLAVHAETLTDHDQRIEDEAKGTKAVVGLTSRCPYGLAACWGGAYQTLKVLKDVDQVKAIANSDDSTAEVFLTGDVLPDIDSWRQTFRDIVKGGYDFRGVEVTLTGAVRMQNGGLTLSGSGWSIGLSALRAADKVQWDRSQQQPAAPTPDESTAYNQLLDRVRVGGELPSVEVTGPLVNDGGGRRLHVRRAGGS
jgi:galactose oxidase